MKLHVKLAATFATLLVATTSHAGLDDKTEEASKAKRGSVEWLKENEAEFLGNRVSVEISGWSSKQPKGVKYDMQSEVRFAESAIYVRDEKDASVYVRYDTRDEEKLKKKYTANSKNKKVHSERISGVLKKLPNGTYLIDISKLDKEKDFLGESEKKEGEDKKEEEKK